MLKTRFSAATRFAGAVMCAATALMGSVVHATITADWSITPGSGQAYFPAADTTCRGLAYNPVTNNVLVAKSGTAAIQVVDESSGVSLATMNVTGVSGGAATLGKVKVVDYGSNVYSVFACNIVTDTRAAAASCFKLYHWYSAGPAVAAENTLAAPKVIFNNNADDGVSSTAGVPTAVTGVVGPKLPAAGSTGLHRIGDTMAVVNSGNNVQIYVAISDGFVMNKVLRFDFTNTGNPTTDVVTAVTQINLSGLPAAYNYGTALRGLAVDGYNGPIYHSTNAIFAKFTNAGVYQSLVTGTMNSATGGAGGGHPVIGSYNSRKYLVTLAEAGQSASAVAALNRFAVADFDTTTTVNNRFLDVGAAPTTTVLNSNVTGDFGINSATGKIYALASANQIGRFTIPALAAGVTKKWDGGASTTNWFDPTNWAPDGVPTSQDDVVLDNTTVATPYTVALTATTSEAFARTIAVGGGASVVTLQIPSTNAVRSALIVSGDGNASTDDILVKNNGVFDYSPSNTTTSSNVVYFGDPLSTVRVQNGGKLYVNSARPFTAFPPDLPAGYQPNLYGRTIFDTGSTLEVTNVAGTTVTNHVAGRTLSTLRFSGTAGARGVTTSLPIKIASFTTSVTGYSGTWAVTAPLEIASMAPTGTFTGTMEGYPLTISGTTNWPAGLVMAGDVVIPSGVTVTGVGAFNLGAADAGGLVDIAGTLARGTGFATTCNSAVLVRNGGSITGTGTWTWGSAGGLGINQSTGLSATPASDYSWLTAGTNVPSNFFTGLPALTAGTWVFCGDVADQAPGAFFSGGTARNITIRTTGSVALAANLNVSNRLRLVSGIVKTGANTLQLGTSNTVLGTLTYGTPSVSFPQSSASIQGNFKRWYNVTALAVGTAAIAGTGDFPMTDGTNRRMLTIVTSAAPPAGGGTVNVEYVAADPGGTINAALSTTTNTSAYGLRAGVVRTDGYWKVTPSFTIATANSTTYTTDVTGDFGVDTIAGNASVISRPAAGAWAIGGAAQGTPTAALVQGIQASSNPTAADYAYRISRAGFIALSSSAAAEVGVATKLTNAGPSALGISASAINENNAANAVVGTLSATNDTWSGESLTYSLIAGTGDTDNSLFNISGSSLRVTTANALNYEAASSRSVRVRVTDGGYPYLTQDLVIPITVNDVNEAPSAVALTSTAVAENSGFLVGDLSSTDPDAGNTFTYTITGGTDSAAFNIVGNQLFFNSPPNFEAQSSYAVTVTSTDQGSLTKAQAFTVTVTNVNEAPALVTISNLNVNENTTTVGNLGVIDPDAGATATYDLVSGTGSTNNALFQITGGNVLSFISAPNYEAQTSYSVRVRATDTTAPNATVERAFTVSVKNVNEAPTSLVLSSTTIAEGATTVGTFSATDQDAGSSFTYSLVAGAGGDDNTSATIVGNTLSFIVPANFEAKPVWNVRARVTDNGSPSQTYTLPFTINVVDANEAPTDITLSNSTINEAAAASTVGNLAAVDVDAGASATFALVSGTGDTDNAKFSLAGNSLSTVGPTAFGTYSVRVQATDNGTPGLTFQKALTITVNDVPTLALTTSAVGSLASSIVSDAGTITSVVASAAPAPLPANTTLPLGVWGFQITGLTNGQSVSVTINYPSTAGINKAYKVNGTTYTEIVGATVSATSISYTVTDGGAGDQDGTANGTIVDPAGPAVFNSAVNDWTLLND